MGTDRTFADIVTAHEAARYLRVSKATVLRLAQRGVIVGVRLGRQWRFSREMLAELVRHPERIKRAGGRL